MGSEQKSWLTRSDSILYAPVPADRGKSVSAANASFGADMGSSQHRGKSRMPDWRSQYHRSISQRWQRVPSIMQRTIADGRSMSDCPLSLRFSATSWRRGLGIGISRPPPQRADVAHASSGRTGSCGAAPAHCPYPHAAVRQWATPARCPIIRREGHSLELGAGNTACLLIHTPEQCLDMVEHTGS
jgi:hypothetical protein